MTASTPLVARHGDSWTSQWFVVAIDGISIDLADWTIRAQARLDSEAAEIVFEWSVPAGTIELGTAEVRLADETVIETGALRLLIRPSGWAGKPRSWQGVLDIELSSDATASPALRRTVVAGRKFKVTPDVARG